MRPTRPIRATLWYAGLLVATAIVAAVLIDVNLHAWNILGDDPQGFDQVWDSYLASGAFAYTSGAVVGQTCALLAGLLVARRAVSAAPVVGLGLAILAGLGLWLTASAVALPLASVRLRGVWMLDELTRNYPERIAGSNPPFEPNVLSHPSIVAAVAMNAVGYLLAACLGYGLGLDPRPRIRLVWVRFAAALVYALAVAVTFAYAGFLAGSMQRATTIPQAVTSLAVYGVVTAAYIEAGRPGLTPERALAPLPLLFLFTPLAALALLDMDRGGLAPLAVFALAVWAVVVCVTAIINAHARAPAPESNTTPGPASNTRTPEDGEPMSGSQ